MTTNETQNVDNTFIPPVDGMAPGDSSVDPSDAAYAIGMALALQAADKDAATAQEEQAMNANNDLKDVILQGVHDQFQSAGEMAAYFSYLAANAANLGISPALAGWLTTQAQTITSSLSANLNPNLSSYIELNVATNGNPQNKDAKYENQFNMYVNAVDAQIKEVANSGDVIQKADQEANLTLTASAQKLDANTESMASVISSATSIGS